MSRASTESPYYLAFRSLARQYIYAGISPADAHFDATGRQPSLFPKPDAPDIVPLRVPRAFTEIARIVCCHRDPLMLRTLYSALWRLQHGEPRLLEDPADPDTRALSLAERAIRRDMHKMTAFVRFRRTVYDNLEHYIAWHRPDHFIVHLTAPFFVQRFGSMRWAILTPDDSVFWNLEELQFRPGVPQSEAPTTDELEGLWLTYYSAIFNPARLMVNAMIKELPVRHWPTLPESRLIPELIRDAANRVDQMRQAPRIEMADYSNDTLPVLASRISACRDCELYAHATQAVCGEGPADASFMLVGEQPGDVEDTSGRPFVGPAGKILDRALAAAHIDRQQVYLTNAVKHFYHEERGKRRLHKKPRGTHIAACQHWLHGELQIVKPKVVVALGATAGLALLGRQVTIERDRGSAIPHALAGMVVVTNHPSYILRLPDEALREREFARMVEDLRLAATCTN
jgi:DNA polymerase